MKKACVITLAVIMLAAGGLLIYYLADNSSRRQNKFRGTLVKEYGEWKISCM